MIIDSKGKLFGKISIIDVLIVVIILAIVGGVAVVFKRTKAVSPFSQTDNIEISFYAEEIPDFAVKAINKGDLAKDFERNCEYGHVTDIKSDKSITWVETANGEMNASTKAGYSSVLLTVEGKGVFHDSKNYAGVTFGSSDLFIGRTVTVLVGHSTFQCRIYDIKKKG